MLDALSRWIFLASAGLGLWAMGPTVGFGDSGELAAAAAGLGLPHSPGYPLFCLSGKAFGSALSMGNWAYRTNYLSVLISAGTLGLFADTLRVMGMGVPARLAGVLFLGLSPEWLWSGNSTEVFSLHHLGLAGLIRLLAGLSSTSAERFKGDAGAARSMAAGGLTAGLGLANHHTVVLALPAVLAELFSLRLPRRTWLRGLSLAVGLALAALACYAYLPLRSAAGPPLDWGHPTTLDRFIRVLLRKDYGSFSLTVEGAAPVSRREQLLRYAGETARGLGASAWPVAAIGLAAWRGLGLGLGAGFPALWVLGTGPLLLLIGNPPWDPQTSYALARFYPASWLGLCLLIAAGAEVLSRCWGPSAWLLALSAVLGSGSRMPEWMAREDFSAYDYGRSLMKSLPPRSALFIDGGDDTFYALTFLSYAQGLRPDLEIHDRGGLVFPSAYGADFRPLGKEAKERRRIEVESRFAFEGRLFYATLADNLTPGTELRTHGLLRRAAASGMDPPAAAMWEIYPRRWNFSLAGAHYRYRALISFYPFMRAANFISELRSGRPEAAARALRELEIAYLTAPDALWIKPSLAHSAQLVGFEAARASDWPGAERAYRFGLRISPGDPELNLNLGVALDHRGENSEAEDSYRRAAALSPSSAGPWRNLGSLYWKQKRWADAREAFQRARSLAPEDRSLAGFAQEASRRAAGGRP